MRRLTFQHTDERGAVAVVVAVLLVVLLGFAALALDMARIYSEKAQLQNGADAAAISLAQVCAEDVTNTSCDEASPLSGSYAKANTLDGFTHIADDAVVLEKDKGRVSITVGAQNEGGEANELSMSFARVLGIDSATIQAESTAIWGSPIEGPAPFPVAFSHCEVDVEGNLQVIQARASTNLNCEALKLPGGFGWMDEKNGPCVVEKTGVGPLILNSNPGNDVSANCQTVLKSWAEKLKSGEKVIRLLPVFDEAVDDGSNATYNIIGFAAFEIYGWHLKQNTNSYPEEFRSSVTLNDVTATCTGKCIGIIGRFVRHVSLDETYTLGPISDLGTSVVELAIPTNESH